MSVTASGLSATFVYDGDGRRVLSPPLCLQVAALSICVTISPVQTPTILLASNSPRRRELLGWTGWSFILYPLEIDEQPLPGEEPRAYVLRLAEDKARSAAGRAELQPGTVILAADTIVADGSELLGKPANRAEAEAMLRSLRGRLHQVFTALALFDPRRGALLLDCCRADVPMRSYSDAEIQAYIESGDPLDKAGAYAIQHSGFHPVVDFRGCYACVVGLPLCHLARSLRKLGIEAPHPIPALCQANLGYDCPIYQKILAWADE